MAKTFQVTIYDHTTGCIKDNKFIHVNKSLFQNYMRDIRQTPPKLSININNTTLCDQTMKLTSKDYDFMMIITTTTTMIYIFHF